MKAAPLGTPVRRIHMTGLDRERALRVAENFKRLDARAEPEPTTEEAVAARTQTLRRAAWSRVKDAQKSLQDYAAYAEEAETWDDDTDDAMACARELQGFWHRFPEGG